MNETVDVEGIGSVEVRFSERGAGQPVLLLHGGGGLASVVPWADLLTSMRPARVITPTHPGIGGTPRPRTLTSVRDLARLYVALIDKLELGPVAVIGHSIGGWIAAEMGIVGGERIGCLVLLDAVGIEEIDHPALDVFSGTPRTESDRALKMYAGKMMDPSLRPRLGASSMPPTLIVWGETDGVVDVEYGRSYARAIRGAEFLPLRGVGHGPQVEAPELVVETVWPFVAKHTG
jgi:pimeloyl-ACP methyl ester carboxylesterase